MHIMFARSKDLPGDIFEAGAEFLFILHVVSNDRALMTDDFMKIVTSSVSTSVDVSCATIHLRGTF